MEQFIEEIDKYLGYINLDMILKNMYNRLHYENYDEDYDEVYDEEYNEGFLQEEIYKNKKTYEIRSNYYKNSNVGKNIFPNQILVDFRNDSNIEIFILGKIILERGGLKLLRKIFF